MRKAHTIPLCFFQSKLRVHRIYAEMVVGGEGQVGALGRFEQSGGTRVLGALRCGLDLSICIASSLHNHHSTRTEEQIFSLFIRV